MPETQVQFLGGEEPLGEGNGHTLQYSRLENSMDRGAQWATVHGVAKSQTRPRTNTIADCTFLRWKKIQISRDTQSSKSSRKKWTRCLFLLGLKWLGFTSRSPSANDELRTAPRRWGWGRDSASPLGRLRDTGGGTGSTTRAPEGHRRGNREHQTRPFLEGNGAATDQKPACSWTLSFPLRIYPCGTIQDKKGLVTLAFYPTIVYHRGKLNSINVQTWNWPQQKPTLTWNIILLLTKYWHGNISLIIEKNTLKSKQVKIQS